MELRKQQANYRVALKRYEDIKTQETETREQALQEKEYYNEETRERITDPFEDMMMSEENYIKYLKECYKINQNKGIAGKDYDDNFTYTAKEELTKAENELIEAFKKTGIIPASQVDSMAKHWSYRESLLEKINKLQ